MALRFHRALLVVSSMEASLAFFEGILGLERISDDVREGGCYDQITGIFGVRVRVAFLGIGGGPVVLELVEYLSPGSLRRQWEMSDLGAVRICLACDDLVGMEEVLREKLSRAARGPYLLEKDGRRVARVLLVRDPDGYEIEIRQELMAQE